MKIKATVHIDNTDIQKRIKLLKIFFKPGGQAHRILDEEALKTRDKIRIDVLVGKDLSQERGDLLLIRQRLIQIYLSIK